jgi:hypothetical protein
MPKKRKAAVERAKLYILRQIAMEDDIHNELLVFEDTQACIDELYEFSSMAMDDEILVAFGHKSEVIHSDNRALNQLYMFLCEQERGKSVGKIDFKDEGHVRIMLVEKRHDNSLALWKRKLLKK